MPPERQAVWLRPLGAALERMLPASLFGRLALLLVVVAISSHILALTLLFQLSPPPAPWLGGSPHPPPPLPHAGPHGPPPLGLLMDMLVRLLALLLAAWVGARWLSQPVRRLADAARELGQDVHRAPLPEEGTLECREATQVFNQMQTRIQEQLAQRDLFVAAVSHDLRTPLTRLALRVESLSDSTERQRFGRDIAEMDTMIRVTLDYLRGAARPESMAWMDVRALVQSLVQDARETGQNVHLCDLPPMAPIRAIPTALRRCLGNLLDNAVRYGHKARVTVEDGAQSVAIAVIDSGPGIPDDELEKVLLPFYRVEVSRNRNHGGVGLGLASAHDIARQHGGSLHLVNEPAGGLRVTLTLPKNVPHSLASRR